jgi:hypothetical protein
MKVGDRIRIVGDHPWSGSSGTIASLEGPMGMLRVRLDEDLDTPAGHECFAEPRFLRAERRSPR